MCFPLIYRHKCKLIDEKLPTGKEYSALYFVKNLTISKNTLNKCCRSSKALHLTPRKIILSSNIYENTWEFYVSFKQNTTCSCPITNVIQNCSVVSETKHADRRDLPDAPV